MEEEDAKKEKTLAAEKQMSIVRAIMIVFGTFSFFLLSDPHTRSPLALYLIAPIWLYGAFILFFKPYKKYPIFLASWFTYTSDCIFTTLWIYATGGFHSPFHVIYYTSIIAVAYRFGIRTTLFTCTLYAVAYLALLHFMDQLRGVEGRVLIRAGFVYIVGYMSYLITRETLWQTREKLQLRRLMAESKINEEKLRALNKQLRIKNDLFDHAEQNADLGSYYLHLNTGELRYSDNMFRLLGHEPDAFKPTIATYTCFVHPDDRLEVEKSAEDMVKNSLVREAMTHRLITHDGIVKYVRATSKMVGTENDQVIIGTLQDVTADIAMQQALREKNAVLEQINNELSSFNYVASHDLQEPVRKILTFTELVREKESGNISESSLNYLDRIRAASKRMQELIRAFLSYSHINNSDFDFENVELNEIMEDVRHSLSEQLDEKKARFEWKDLPALSGKKIQLQQLFINLVGNAIKYSRPDIAPEILVSSEVVKGIMGEVAGAKRQSKYLKICVSDNGIGFSEQYAEKIFDVFVRLHSRDQYEGTGIGLAICKKIVKNHRGFIRAESSDQGARFYVYLPLPETGEEAESGDSSI